MKSKLQLPTFLRSGWLCGLVLVFIASCTGNKTFQKRRYLKGYYHHCSPAIGKTKTFEKQAQENTQLAISKETQIKKVEKEPTNLEAYQRPVVLNSKKAISTTASEKKQVLTKFINTNSSLVTQIKKPSTSTLPYFQNYKSAGGGKGLLALLLILGAILVLFVAFMFAIIIAAAGGGGGGALVIIGLIIAAVMLIAAIKLLT